MTQHPGAFPLALRFLVQELGRYGPSSGLRSALATRLARAPLEGTIITALPSDVVAAVAATGDPLAWNGSPRYFGLSDADAQLCPQRETAFLLRLLSPDQPAPLRLYAFRAYHHCVAGLDSRTGANELLNLLPLDPTLTGFADEGWSERCDLAPLGEDTLEETLAYSTLPYPPGLAIVTAAEPPAPAPVMRVRRVDDSWMHRRLETLRLIIVLAFDNRSLLMFAPHRSGGPRHPLATDVLRCAAASGLQLLTDSAAR